MDKLEPQTSKEATWRDRLARHAASGKSIAAFCRDDAISAASFHLWRTKLANDGNEQAARPPAPQSAFIDPPRDSCAGYTSVRDASRLSSCRPPLASTA